MDEKWLTTHCHVLAETDFCFVKARELEQPASNSRPCGLDQALAELRALSLSLVAAIQMITPKAILFTTSAKL
jgi:hypothetical protein